MCCFATFPSESNKIHIEQAHASITIERNIHRIVQMLHAAICMLLIWAVACARKLLLPSSQPRQQVEIQIEI